MILGGLAFDKTALVLYTLCRNGGAMLLALTGVFASATAAF